ncbi:FBXL2, partial [Symbiodinium microadriaticum]
AAVIAHPGQILEPNSLLKWRYSFIIHFLLVAAAGGGQLLVRTSTAPPACKVLPDMLLIAWLVVSFVSWAALGLLSWLGHHVEQPRFVALASGDEPVIAYSTLLAGFPSPDDQVPKAVLAAMQGKVAVDLTTDAAARGLTQQGLERILESTGDVRFNHHVVERLAIRLKAVVEGLATSHPTIVLHLPDFLHVPADSWERLGASLDSERLQKVNLFRCFERSGAGSKALLAGLARCRKLQELVMHFCCEVPGEAWAELGAAEWPELRKASFAGCFLFHGEGSEELLAALGRSRRLEEVDFDRCEKIPDAAWKLLGDGAWPRLRVAKGVRKEHLQRLREASLDLEAGAGEAASSLELQQEPGAKQLPMYPTFITSVVMPGKGGAAAVRGDLGLLPALARSDVEELNLYLCRDVPAAVWQQLGQAQGEVLQKLRKATFKSCFDKDSKGAEGVAGLLLALSHCQLLQELGMQECYKVPAAAWQLLATARWEQLRKADFTWCFNDESKGGEGAAWLLSALARCRQLQELLMGGCSQIPASAWQQLEGAQWLKLTKVDFDKCFCSGSKGIEAAAGLLTFLGRCPELQDLSMSRCNQIPVAAWQQLEGATWRKLAKVDFRCFNKESKGIEAAAGLLAFLGRCPELQDLCMPGCNQIPVAAWQQLEGATWRKLTKVDFRQCFDKESKGIEAAAGLLAALARCPELQELQMSFCSEIPAAAWQQLQGATWPKLTKVEVDQCFGENSKGADGVAGLLTALARCAELKDGKIYGLSREHLEELRRLRRSS